MQYAMTHFFKQWVLQYCHHILTTLHYLFSKL